MGHNLFMLNLGQCVHGGKNNKCVAMTLSKLNGSPIINEDKL